MRSKIGFLLFVGALVVFLAVYASAATMTWEPPDTYVDETLIPAADQARIVYKAYSGPAVDGPWTEAATTAPGATSATVPDPARGATLWYTAEAILDGQTSDKAGAVAYTRPFPATKPPKNPKAMK